MVVVRPFADRLSFGDNTAANVRGGRPVVEELAVETAEEGVVLVNLVDAGGAVSGDLRVGSRAA
eukprot:9018157-Prorocentrum_lima.AAC.1